MCNSSPFEKFRSSSELCSRTVPFVSVCAMSMPHVYTPTLAPFAFLTMPSGSLPKTMPLMTLELDRPAPMILTTRTLSTLKCEGSFGITASEASATNAARRSSCPYCFEARGGRSAMASDSAVKGRGSVSQVSAVGSEDSFQCASSWKTEETSAHFQVQPRPCPSPARTPARSRSGAGPSSKGTRPS